MIRFLADECCPKAVVDRLRADGHDVRYADETDHQITDDELLARANAENRIIVTGDLTSATIWCAINCRRPA